MSFYTYPLLYRCGSFSLSLPYSRFELDPTNVVLSLGDCVVYGNGSFQLGGTVEKAVKKHLQDTDMVKRTVSSTTHLPFPPHLRNVRVGGKFPL